MSEPLKLWVSTDHEGHWPVGVASVVWAATEKRARELLVAKLREHGLKSEPPFTLNELPMVEGAHVLNDGNY